MGVGGVLFAALALATGSFTLWGSAAAINFLGGADAIR
jgi:hypothetical protein